MVGERRRLVRGKLVGEKEGIDQRLAGRRKRGDWSEAMVKKKRRRSVRG